MSKRSDWYDSIFDAINNYKDRFDAKAYKKNKLELLLRVSWRVDGFSQDCSECPHYQDDITKLVKNLGDPVSSTKKDRKKNSKVINLIIEHLKKHHKLVSEGHYVGMAVGLGLVFGASLGITFGNLTFGAAFGLIIGVVIGNMLDSRAKKQGRII